MGALLLVGVTPQYQEKLQSFETLMKTSVKPAQVKSLYGDTEQLLSYCIIHEIKRDAAEDSDDGGHSDLDIEECKVGVSLPNASNSNDTAQFGSRRQVFAMTIRDP
jgi:hypothetical protein